MLEITSILHYISSHYTIPKENWESSVKESSPRRYHMQFDFLAGGHRSYFILGKDIMVLHILRISLLFGNTITIILRCSMSLSNCRFLVVMVKIQSDCLISKKDKCIHFHV